MPPAPPSQLSIFALLLFLLLLSSASATASCKGTCPVPEQVTGFAVFASRPEDANAFVQDLRPLITASRNEPGNINYAMYTNPSAPGLVGFTERYSNSDALKSHLNADHVTSIVDHEYYRTLRSASPQLFGPWTEVSPDECIDHEEIEMVFYWNMNCTRQHVWNIITKWDNASWVLNVVNTTVVPLRPDGNPMSDEEAAAHGPVDSDGLANVVQRRKFSNGFVLDVRMVERNDTTFVTVQETVTPLVFPAVKFDKFFVTISLLTDGVDADTQTRLRYHVRATLLEGTNEQARQTLKGDFYGPRIDHYQEYFNCTTGVNIKTVQNSVSSLHAALATHDRETTVPATFISEVDGLVYLQATFGDVMPPKNTSVRITTPVRPVVTPDLRAMVVEDIIVHTLRGTAVRPRIVLYQFDAWGRIITAKVYDVSVTSCGDVLPPSTATANSWWVQAMHAIVTPTAERPAECTGRDLVDATNRYFEVLKTRDLKQIRPLYADEHELHDPVGFQPPRSFESVYRNFATVIDGFVYTRSPARSFVHAESRQTVQLIDALFDGTTSGLGQFRAQPVQVLTFDEDLKITRFEAYFVPRVLDFSKLQ